MFAQLLAKALHLNHHHVVNAVQQEQLIQYLRCLQRWNRIFNLTRIIDERDLVYLHIIDSLSIHSYIKGNTCLDVGSGGGCPGLALAIAYPEQQWVLIDKCAKKTRFLTQAIAELGLKHVKIVKARVEEFHSAQRFDTIVSRAFSTLSLFMEATQALIQQPHGQWIAMKGRYPKEELAVLPTHIVSTVTPLSIVGINAERHVVCLKQSD